MQYSNCVCVEGDWQGGMICSTAVQQLCVCGRGLARRHDMQYSNCVCVEGDWRGGMICSKGQYM